MGWGANVAVTVLSVFMVTLHVVPLEVSQPLQVSNLDAASGVAVSVTAVPEAIDAEQVAPQLMPPPLTVPDPVPLFWTVNVRGGTSVMVKVAVTVLSAVMVTVQVAPLEVSQPLQLPNVDPLSGAAVSVTAVPEAIDAEQVAPQLTPPPLTVPDPVPLFWTVKLRFETGAAPPSSGPQAARDITSTTKGINLPAAAIVMDGSTW